MSGFSKKSIDKYIRNRIKYWIYNLGTDSNLYLNKELKLSTKDKEKLTEEDREKILHFQNKVKENTIVTGGAFTSMLHGEQPNDLDIYIKDSDIAIMVSNFYLNKMRELGNLKETACVPRIEAQKTDDGVHIFIRSQGVSGVDIDTDQYAYFEMYPEDAVDEFFKQYKETAKNIIETGKSYHVSFMTSNAITLNNGLQIIIRFTGEPEEIHSNFDFIHATNYWTWSEGVVYNAEALSATLEKRLYYFGSKFPVATIFRLKKFIERGWRISAGEIVKIMYDASKLNLDDINVLREQSMGMDSAYFSEVIAILRKDRDKSLDRTYLFKVLNEVFQMHDTQDDFLESKSSGESSVEEEFEIVS